MTFSEAKNHVIFFGQYKGQTLDDTASTDAGLLYLDWLRGEREQGTTEFDVALRAYLDDPTIAAALGQLLDR